MEKTAEPDTAFDRYAVFLAPDAQSPLGRFGNEWLGRDPSGDEYLTPRTLDGHNAVEISNATKVPARYGFHATLKPPFHLKPDASVATFYDTLSDIVCRFPPVRIDHWKVRALGKFVALIPAAPCPVVESLAAALVEGLDGFRSPPTAAELARRRQSALTPRQEALLETWGYPYVMESFRLHFTLSGPLPELQLSALETMLQARIADIPEGHTFADVAVFAEPKRGENFRLIRRFPFGG